MKTPTYGLIGRGRVATHVAHYLELEEQSVSIWHRGLKVLPEEALRDAQVLLLAISDDAIEQFLTDRPELRERRVVHFSGSLMVDRASGLHPLMTFGPQPYDLETYRAIPFVEERNGLQFREAFPALSNRSWAIDPENKALYHALCVLAGNFTTLLWGKAFTEFEDKLGLPREILRPFLERTAANTLDQGEEALTGSLARSDRGTIERDLAALDGDALGEVYRIFARSAGVLEAGA